MIILTITALSTKTSTNAYTNNEDEMILGKLTNTNIDDDDSND